VTFKISHIVYNVLVKEIKYDPLYEQTQRKMQRLRPRKNHARWSRWLTNAYKKRWYKETGFRMLNSIHESFRNRFPFVQLGQLYLRGYVFNCWQYFRKHQINQKIPMWKTSLPQYQIRCTDQICRILEGG